MKVHEVLLEYISELQQHQLEIVHYHAYFKLIVLLKYGISFIKLNIINEHNSSNKSTGQRTSPTLSFRPWNFPHHTSSNNRKIQVSSADIKAKQKWHPCHTYPWDLVCWNVLILSNWSTWNISSADIQLYFERHLVENFGNIASYHFIDHVATPHAVKMKWLDAITQMLQRLRLSKNLSNVKVFLKEISHRSHCNLQFFSSNLKILSSCKKSNQWIFFIQSVISSVLSNGILSTNTTH